MSHLSKLSDMPPVGLVVIVAILSLFVLAVLVLFITYGRYSRLASQVGNLKKHLNQMLFGEGTSRTLYKNLSLRYKFYSL